MRLKKDLSAADIKVLSAEMQRIVGSRVDKIYHPEGGVLAFKFRGQEKLMLFFDTRGFIFFSDEDRDMPSAPSSFAMLLRKHLSGGRVQAVEQHRFDRILRMDVSTGGGDYALIFELFGGGNVILAKDEMILMPLSHKSWKSRTIRPGEEYATPADTPDPTDMDFETFTDIFSISGRDTIRCLALDVNLGGEIAEEICRQAGVDDASPASEIGEADCRTLFSAMEAILGSFAKPEPYVALDEGVPQGFSFLNISRYEGLEKKNFETFSQTVEYFYNNCPREQKKQDTRGDKLLRQMEQQKKAIEDFLQEEEAARAAAEAVYSNYPNLAALLDGVKEARKQGYGWEEIRGVLEKKYGPVSIDPSKSRIGLSIKADDKELPITLNWLSSLEENASSIYDEAKRAREKRLGAEEALKDTEEALSSTIEEQEKKETQTRKTFWFERYKWFVTSEGVLVIAGRDAESNDRIVKKHMRDTDRYAHADFHGAPSVIVKNTGLEIGEESLKEACHFAVIQSKAWSAKIGSGDAYWVLPEQVSKTPNPGEFIARGAFVIRGKRNYHRRLPLRAMLSTTIWEGVDIVMCSPPYGEPNKPYVIIEPGEEKKSSSAKRIAEVFGVGVDEIMRMLPPGNIRIVDITK